MDDNQVSIDEYLPSRPKTPRGTSRYVDHFPMTPRLNTQVMESVAPIPPQGFGGMNVNAFLEGKEEKEEKDSDVDNDVMEVPADDVDFRIGLHKADKFTPEEIDRIIQNRADALRLQAESKARRALEEAQRLQNDNVAKAVVTAKAEKAANRPKPYDWKRRALYLAKQKHYSTLNALKRRVAVEAYKKSVWKAKRANSQIYKKKNTRYRSRFRRMYRRYRFKQPYYRSNYRKRYYKKRRY